jgi:hypothetical protein
MQPASSFLWTGSLIFLLGTVGCSSATYIKTKVTENPINRVVDQSGEIWSKKRIDSNTLELSQPWPTSGLERVLFFWDLESNVTHANLSYDAAALVLHIQYYLEARQLLMLFIPFYVDAEPAVVVGRAVKPAMNAQIQDILRWSGASVLSRRVEIYQSRFLLTLRHLHPQN